MTFSISELSLRRARAFSIVILLGAPSFAVAGDVEDAEFDHCYTSCAYAGNFCRDSLEHDMRPQEAARICRAKEGTRAFQDRLRACAKSCGRPCTNCKAP